MESRTSWASASFTDVSAGRWSLDTDDFVVFELGGALLALFGVEELGRDAHALPERGHGGIRSSIIVTVDRPEDVGELTERARAAGAHVTKEPIAAEFFDGRDAYFADPEGNYWEIAWSAGDNPVTAAARPCDSISGLGRRHLCVPSSDADAAQRSASITDRRHGLWRAPSSGPGDDGRR